MYRFRIYPSKEQERQLQSCLNDSRNLWNSLLKFVIKHYEETEKFPTRTQLHLLTKNRENLYSQAAQNVADRLVKSLKIMIAKKKMGKKVGFPRFKPMGRTKSITYPQCGFKIWNRLRISKIGDIQIKKHRKIRGKIKNLTLKNTPSGKWYAIFTTAIEVMPSPKTANLKTETGMDLGIENFAYLCDGRIIENPRHLKNSNERLKQTHKELSRKKKESENGKRARLKLAHVHEKIMNRRADFLHKTSRILVDSYSLIAMEDLNVSRLSKGFLAKHVLDCSWAEFKRMLHYKAEEAGSEVILVDPAYPSQECSSCGSIQKKTLAERQHKCSCGADMHRDLNAAKNILKRATGGAPGSNACEEETSTHGKHIGQVSSMKQECSFIGGKSRSLSYE